LPALLDDLRNFFAVLFFARLTMLAVFFLRFVWLMADRPAVRPRAS
jgi:hypothetical protein